jgi:uncharacterized RDD family membrane protein YckC
MPGSGGGAGPRPSTGWSCSSSTAWCGAFGILLTVATGGDREVVPLIAAAPLPLVDWLYFAKLESSARQATIGKRALGIAVTDLAGRRISFGRATGRYFAKFLSSVAAIGFLMAGFTARKQALHDMIAGCLVVRRR